MVWPMDTDPRHKMKNPKIILKKDLLKLLMYAYCNVCMHTLKICFVHLVFVNLLVLKNI